MPTKPTTICVIDDDAIVRDSFAFVLPDYGFEVLTADGGAQGVRVAGERALDVVLTDVNLADSDGLAVIKQLRAAHPSMLIVAMTGGGDRDGAALTGLALAAGADHALLKPFKPTRLLALLAAYFPLPEV